MKRAILLAVLAFLLAATVAVVVGARPGAPSKEVVFTRRVVALGDLYYSETVSVEPAN